MHLLIPAAGRGSRMGSTLNKLLLPLLDRPVLAWTLRAADLAPSITWIGIVGQPVDYEAISELLRHYPLKTPVLWIVGGATRQESVYRGLLALPAAARSVLIHDGARCLATPDLFDRCSAALLHSNALIAAVPVKDTIKQVQPETGYIEATVPREKLWAAQTPQGFKVELLAAAHHWAIEQSVSVTDDAALCELRGQRVAVVAGEETNLKVTTPADLWLAEAILKQQSAQQQPDR